MELSKLAHGIDGQIFRKIELCPSNLSHLLGEFIDTLNANVTAAVTVNVPILQAV